MPNEFKPLISFIIALFVSYMVLPKLASIALRIGLLDEPGGRKIHHNPCPLVGGLGITMSLCFTSLLFVPLAGLRGYFSGLILLVLVGFFDDFKELGHWRKFAAQIIATFLMIHFSKIILFDFGNLLGLGSIIVPFSWLRACVTIFCVVGVINSINMIDGLDGLAGGLSFVALITFALFGALTGDHASMLISASLAGAVFGFLILNWPPASIFMGDAGSLVLGFSLAYLSIALTQPEDSAIPPAAALLVLAVPITDTLTLMSKRAIKGNNPFRADRYHLHHIILRYGFNQENVVRTIIGLSVILSAIAVTGVIFKVPDWILFLVFALYFISYVIISFFIPNLLKIRLKFKHERSWPQKGVLKVFGKFLSTFLKLLNRREKRYDVLLKVTCKDEDLNETVSGSILNISQHGCTLRVPDLRFRRDKLRLEINLPLEGASSSLVLSGEGIWFAKKDDGQCHHGVQFVNLRIEQIEILKSFINSIMVK